LIDALGRASVLSLAVAIVAAVLRLAGLAGLPPSGAFDVVPLLFAAACLCAASLLRRRAPVIAWLAITAAAGLSALEIVGVIRHWLPAVPGTTRPWLVLLAEFALVATVVVALAYAAQRRTGVPNELRRVGLGGLVVVCASAAWAVEASFLGVASTPDDGPLRLSGRVAAAVFAAASVAGAWLDLAGPLRRARARSSAARDLPRALMDDLLPIQPAARRRLREEERARLAADLHALVLPDLRRAASAARSGEAAAPVAAELEQAIRDVEELLNRRQSVVFEQYGLVAALEWLAERTQVRADIDVDLELEGAAVDDLDPIPAEVRRAAFRVALMALDNVVRHAEARGVVMTLTATPDSLQLAIDDDGRGIDPAAARAGSRGLVDMRAEAGDVGAAFEVEPRTPGTRVLLRWPASG
jgi:signal transduction histidine kinase